MIALALGTGEQPAATGSLADKQARDGLPTAYACLGPIATSGMHLFQQDKHLRST